MNEFHKEIDKLYEKKEIKNKIFPKNKKMILNLTEGNEIDDKKIDLINLPDKKISSTVTNKKTITEKKQINFYDKPISKENKKKENDNDNNKSHFKTFDDKINKQISPKDKKTDLNNLLIEEKIELDNNNKSNLKNTPNRVNYFLKKEDDENHLSIENNPLFASKEKKTEYSDFISSKFSKPNLKVLN